MKGDLVFVSEHPHLLHVAFGNEKKGVDFQGASALKCMRIKGGSKSLDWNL